LKLRLWSDGLLDPTGLMVTPEREIECAHLTLEFQRYFAAGIEERRRAPKDDILTALSQRLEGEDPFSVGEVLNMLEQIVTGGNETTTSLITSGLLKLIDNPAQEQILRADPSRIPTFVEEVLRLESPVQSNFRSVTEDTVLGGVAIPKGSTVLLRYGAANRDEATFQDAETLDVCRSDARRHVAFGFGVHHCPGSMLARQEAVSTFRELFRRYERFELTVDRDALHYHPTFFLRGLESLPVRLVARTD
jgi:cytochrome P450